MDRIIDVEILANTVKFIYPTEAFNGAKISRIMVSHVPMFPNFGAMKITDGPAWSNALFVVP